MGGIIYSRGLAVRWSQLSDGSEKGVGVGNIPPIYIDRCGDRGMIYVFGKAAVENFCQKEKHFLGVSSLEAQDNALNLLS